MVGVIYEYVATVFEFYGYFFYYLISFVNCLVGCFIMIVWTPAVSSVLYALVLFVCLFVCACVRVRVCVCVCVCLYLHLFSAADHVSHGKTL